MFFERSISFLEYYVCFGFNSVRKKNSKKIKVKVIAFSLFLAVAVHEVHYMENVTRLNRLAHVLR